MHSGIPIIPPRDGSDVPAEEMRRPGFWVRLFCCLLDGAVVVALGMAIWVYVLDYPIPDIEEAEGVEAIRHNAEFVLYATVATLYFTVMHGTFGKTLGKMAGRFRVVAMDGGRIGYGRAFVRAFFFTGILAAVELPRLLYPDAALGWISDFGLLYFIANCLSLVWNRNVHRALHDRIAGTRVIREAGGEAAREGSG